MTNIDPAAYVNALAEGRRPPAFAARPEEVAVLRVAIELAALRPGEGVADETFLARTYQELSGESPDVEGRRQKERRSRRRRALMVTAVAAAIATLSVVLTRAADHPVPVVRGTASTSVARVGSFVGRGHTVSGTIVLTEGPPSWVFMAVEVPGYKGVVICRLQSHDGSVVAMAALHLRNGMVVWNRSLPTGINRLDRATLFDPAGHTVAVATLA